MKACARFFRNDEDDGWTLADCSIVDQDHDFGEYAGELHMEMLAILIPAASGKFTRP